MTRNNKTNRLFRWIIGQPVGLSSPNLLQAFYSEGDRLIDLRYGDSTSNRLLLEQISIPDTSRLYLRVEPGENIPQPPNNVAQEAHLIFGNSTLEEKDRSFFEKVSSGAQKYGFEVDNAEQVRRASEVGASFLIVSGNEAYGSVSDKTSLIISQEIIPRTLLPVIVRGNLGPYAAAAMSALGAAGVILDTPLLLANESPLDDSLKKKIGQLSPTDSLTLGYGLSRRFRMSGQPGMKAWKTIKDRELEILTKTPDDSQASAAVVSLYWEHCKMGFADTNAQLLPVGQGVPYAAKLAERFGSTLKIIEYYESVRKESISSVREAFPFAKNSPLAKAHQTLYPIVQGPMSNVSERAEFAEAISQEGALPFMALSTLASDKVLDIINRTKEALGNEPFGVGLIGFKTSPVYEDHVNLILEHKPPYVTVAGGDPELSRRFDEAGLKTYLHAPSPHHAKSFLEEGAQRLIFEGHEAGGHIGSLGSVLLWEQGVAAILEVCEADPAKAPKGVLFAGGIAHFHTVLVAAIIAEPLARKGIPVGIQLGTAYLSTKEIVDTQAAQPNYRARVIAGEQTLSFGHSINMPTRCVDSQFPRELLTLERKLEGDTSVSLNDRKIKIEEENRGHLRIAAKGIQRSTDRNPGYESVPEEDQLTSGAYHAGQCISQIWQQRTIKQLHAFLLGGAQNAAKILDYQPAWSALTQEDSEPTSPGDAIAIVGMSCRVPGANDCGTFWDNILQGKSYIRDMDRSRFDFNPYLNDLHDESLRFKTILGGFIDPVKPNPSRYKIPPSVAASIDPIQWLILELVEQALASGSIAAEDLPQERTTVIIGNSGGGEWPYSYRLLANAPLIGKDLEACDSLESLSEEQKLALKNELITKLRERTPPIEQDSWYVGQLPTIIAGRIANVFNFNGGCSVVDAACASGLNAIDVAMDGLRKGKFDAAVVGAAEMRMDPGTYLGFSSLNALSSNGCFPFDQKADGTVIGEGGGLVILKRLDDAERDGNTIWGLVRGIGSSTDGKGKGLTAPNYQGQILAMERAYQSSGISPNSVSYIEAHGTGTPLGDESELLSTTEILTRHSASEKHCLIGSVKAQTGHLRSSAGMIGLIKAVLALHHKELPPTINCETPSNVIDWDKSPLYVLNQSKPWRRNGGPLRAGVNAFGFGGVNYHAILEEAPRSQNSAVSVTETAASNPPEKFPAELFIYSAASRTSLVVELEEHIATVSNVEDSGDFFAYSIECYRKANVDQPVLSIVAESPEKLKQRLIDSIKLLKEGSNDEFQIASGIYYSEIKDKGKVAFLCPGQGAHFVGMGSEIAHFFPQVRNIFETVNAQYQSMTGENLLKIMWVPDGAPSPKPVLIPDPTHVDAAQLARTDRSQPAITAVSVAIAELLNLAGLTPEMAAGHSLGEYTACYLAGALDLETLIYMVSSRGVAMFSHKEGKGAMAAISAPIEEIEKTLTQVKGYVIIANRNCPAQSTISGEEDAVKEACALIKDQGYDALLLPISVAFHTEMVAPVADKIYALRHSVRVGQARFPIQSNVMGEFYPRDVPFSASFWNLISRHAASPVRFIENLNSLYQEGARTFIELGPGSALTGFTQATLTSEPITAGSCMLRKGSQVVQFLRMMGLLASKGKKPNLERLFAHRITAQESQKAVSPTRTQPRQIPDNMQPAISGAIGNWRPQLPNVPAEILENYLAQRGQYLGEMMQSLVETDFRHFSQHAPSDRHTPSTSTEQEVFKKDAVQGSSLAHDLKQIFSTKTGYPVDELDLDLDLEADLGIDSIKQTEILQEIRAFFDLESGFTIERSAITLSDWMDAVAKVLPEESLVSPAEDVSSESSGVKLTILEIFSAKTGYPIDDLEENLDLEADLGIDSIKQTEILQQIRESFTFVEDNFTVPRNAVSISDWVKRIEGAIKEKTQPEHGPSEEVSEEQDRHSHLPKPKTNARAWITHLVNSPHENIEVSSLAGKTILLLGDEGDSHHDILQTKLASLGAKLLDFNTDSSLPLTQLPDFLIDLGQGSSRAQDAWQEPEDWWKSIEMKLRSRYALANALISLKDDQKTCTILALTTPGDEFAMTLQGFYRCFHQEHSGLNLKIVEYKTDTSLTALPDQLLNELSKVTKPTHVVYNNEGRHIEHWVEKKFEHEAIPLASCMRDDAVILSIGGARGVTATLSKALIRELKNPTVIVTGRDAEEDINSVPPPLPFDELKKEISDSHGQSNTPITPVKLEQITWRELFRRERASQILKYAEEGITVVYKQLDVVDGAAMNKLIQFCKSSYGRIDLVIHGAAILIERQLAMTKYEDYLNVVRIRGLGTANLITGLSSLERKPTVINLGTGGARFGSPGLTAYGSGHQLAASLVEQWGHSFSTKSKTLIYGPWLDIGMTRQGNSAERFRNRGTDFISPEKGCAFLVNELKSWEQTEIVLRGKPATALDIQDEKSRHPMIESWAKVTPSLIEAVCRFNPETDLWIGRHRIAGEPYFPGVYGIELMAATAAHFRPDLSLKSASKIKWMQPLRFPQNRERLVKISAEITSDSQDTLTCRCQVSTYLKAKQEERVHYECELEFGERRPANEPHLPQLQEGAKQLAPVSLGEMYAYLERHSEHPDRNFEYQSLKSIQSIGKLGVSTAIIGAEDSALSGKLHIRNGVLVDACLHSQFVWQLQFGLRSSSVPLSAEKFEIYGIEEWDELASCRTLILEVHPEKVVSDIEMLNANGLVIGRWKGFTSHIVNRSRNPNGKAIESLIENRQLPSDSRKWADALGLKNLEIGRLDFPVAEEFIKHCKTTLSYRENDQLKFLSALNRRCEFVAGRMAAKSAWLQYQGDFEKPFLHADLSVLSERGQAPVIELHGKQIHELSLSISHTENLVLAAISDERIGIDVQRISDAILKLIDSFTSSSEVDAIRSSLKHGSDQEILTIIWAAKEAIVKASSEPLQASTIDLEKIEPAGNQLKLHFSHPQGGNFDVVVELYPKEAVAIARSSSSPTAKLDGTPSQNEITAEIEKACLAELGNRPQSAEDDLFFDLGCTSISAATIIRALELKFDVRIPLNLLMSYSTVSELSRLISDKLETVDSEEDCSPEPTDIVSPTLFWAQWSGPNFCRHYLPDYQNSYFFKGHWHDDSMDHLTDLKSIVAAYLDEIKAAQPHDPYVLGGYCFGGIIVYEVAKALQNFGETVDHIFLLDPFLPYSAIQLKANYSSRELKTIKAELKESYVPKKHEKGDGKITYARVLNHLKFRINRWRLQKELEGAQSSPDALPVELRAQKVLTLYGDLIEDLKITPYDGRATVITTEKRPEIYHELWRLLVPDSNLNLIQTTSKDHHAITKEPDIQKWVGELAVILSEY